MAARPRHRIVVWAGIASSRRGCTLLDPDHATIPRRPSSTTWTASSTAKVPPTTPRKPPETDDDLVPKQDGPGRPVGRPRGRAGCPLAIRDRVLVDGVNRSSVRLALWPRPAVVSRASRRSGAPLRWCLPYKVVVCRHGESDGLMEQRAVVGEGVVLPGLAARVNTGR